MIAYQSITEALANWRSEQGLSPLTAVEIAPSVTPIWHAAPLTKQPEDMPPSSDSLSAGEDLVHAEDAALQDILADEGGDDVQVEMGDMLNEDITVVRNGDLPEEYTNPEDDEI